MSEIYRKYRVEKIDGTPVDPNVPYFVLRLDTDIHARVAMLAYAESVAIENAKLAAELKSFVMDIDDAAMDHLDVSLSQEFRTICPVCGGALIVKPDGKLIG